MFIRKNVRLIKSLSLCLTSTILVSTAVAGGMDSNQNPVAPKNVPAVQPPMHSSDGYPSAPVPNGAFPIQDPGPYQGDLLPPNQNYPDVGLRKETGADCYCDNAYFKISGGYTINTKGTPIVTSSSRTVADDVNENFNIARVVNPNVINRAIYSLEPKGQNATSSFIAGYKGGALRAEFEGSYSLLLGEDQSIVNGAVTYAVTPNFREYSGIINGYFDLDLKGQAFTPYVGAGIGLQNSNYKYDITSTSGSTINEGSIEYRHTGLVTAGMAGVSLDLTPSFAIDFGYKIKKSFGGKFKPEGSVIENPTQVGLGGSHLAQEVQTFGTAPDTTDVLVQEQLLIADQLEHEVNVGVRYRF